MAAGAFIYRARKLSSLEQQVFEGSEPGGRGVCYKYSGWAVECYNYGGRAVANTFQIRNPETLLILAGNLSSRNSK